MFDNKPQSKEDSNAGTPQEYQTSQTLNRGPLHARLARSTPESRALELEALRRLREDERTVQLRRIELTESPVATIQKETGILPSAELILALMGDLKPETADELITEELAGELIEIRQESDTSAPISIYGSEYKIKKELGRGAFGKVSLIEKTTRHTKTTYKIGEDDGRVEEGHITTDETIYELGGDPDQEYKQTEPLKYTAEDIDIERVAPGAVREIKPQSYALKQIEIIPEGESGIPVEVQKRITQAEVAASLSAGQLISAERISTIHGNDEHRIILKLAEGKELRKELESEEGREKRETTQGWDQMCSVIIDAFRELKSMHGKGFTHADIKQGNIMASLENRQGSIIDFGISRKPLDESGKIIRHGIEGTTPYISAEMFRIDITSSYYDEVVESYKEQGRNPFFENDIRAMLQVFAESRGMIKAKRLKGPESTAAKATGNLLVSVDYGSKDDILFRKQEAINKEQYEKNLTKTQIEMSQDLFDWIRPYDTATQMAEHTKEHPLPTIDELINYFTEKQKELQIIAKGEIVLDAFEKGTLEAKLSDKKASKLQEAVKKGKTQKIAKIINGLDSSDIPEVGEREKYIIDRQSIINEDWQELQSTYDTDQTSEKPRTSEENIALIRLEEIKMQIDALQLGTSSSQHKINELKKDDSNWQKVAAELNKTYDAQKKQKELMREYKDIAIKLELGITEEQPEEKRKNIASEVLSRVRSVTDRFKKAS